MSLTALKKSIKVGDSVDIINHAHPHLSRSAIVVVVQTNAVAVTLPNNTKHDKSWLRWPKAAQCEVDGRRFLTRNPDGTPRLEITFHQEA